MTSLDDLLDRGEEVRQARWTRRETARWMIRAALGAAVATGVVTLAAYGLGYRLWIPLVFGGLFALLVLQRAVATLQVVSIVDQRQAATETLAPPDGLAWAVGQWRSRLTWERAGLWRSSRTLQPTFVELVDERLRQRRGFTRASDPARAREVLGERLWRYLERPHHRRPAPGELADLLTDVERI